MQISGIFTKTKTTKLIGRLGVAKLGIFFMFSTICTGIGTPAAAYVAGDLCATNYGYDMATYYECDCPVSDRPEWIVGPCTSTDPIWCNDGEYGICAGDGGEAACGTCGCSDTYGEWSSPDTNGVVRRTVTRYSNAARYYSCDATTETQTSCGDTYYGNGTKCTRCPSYILAIGTTIRNMSGKSIIGDNTSITDCYMPAGISSRDNTGYFSYEQNCPYSKGFGQL